MLVMTADALAGYSLSRHQCYLSGAAVVEWFA